MTKLSYEKIKEFFEEKNCELLTTEKEFIENEMSAKFSKFNIISSCGHERLNCRFKDFKSRNVGVFCYDCSKNEMIRKLKDNNCQKIENFSIELFKRYSSNKFEIKVMNEATKADIGIRFKNNTTNLWFPIQLKCCSKPLYTVFRFSMCNKNYDNMLIICISLDPVKFWLFNGNDNNIRNVDKIAIGIKSKHNSNEVQLENLEEKLIENIKLFPEYCKTLEELNIPITVTAKKEREFIDYRIENFPNINFIQEINGSHTDFTINSYKIQEKIARFEKDTIIRVDITKSLDGTNSQPYDINDNDYYWIHFPTKSNFILISSKVLFDNGYLTDKNIDRKGKYTLKFYINNIPKWLEDFVYEYKPETEKIIQDIFDNLPKIELVKDIIDIDTLLENNDIKTQKYLDLKYKAKDILCIDCNSIIEGFNAKRCKECCFKNRVIESRNNGRPSYLTLKKELETTSGRKLCSKYNVSVTTLFKWIKWYEKYNLTNI
jgi:hypothetical protein